MTDFEQHVWLTAMTRYLRKDFEKVFQTSFSRFFVNNIYGFDTIAFDEWMFRLAEDKGMVNLGDMALSDLTLTLYGEQGQKIVKQLLLILPVPLEAFSGMDQKNNYLSIFVDFKLRMEERSKQEEVKKQGIASFASRRKPTCT